MMMIGGRAHSISHSIYMYSAKPAIIAYHHRLSIGLVLSGRSTEEDKKEKIVSSVGMLVLISPRRNKNIFERAS